MADRGIWGQHVPGWPPSGPVETSSSDWGGGGHTWAGNRSDVGGVSGNPAWLCEVLQLPRNKNHSEY